MRLNPPTPRTLAVIAKHASAESYHWLLVAGRAHSGVENLARLLAVAYLDEASGLLGRGDPRWAVPRAYLRPGGEVETRERPRWDDPGMPPFVRRELSRIAAWLLGRHRAYVESLSRALRLGEGEEGFRRLTSAEARRRGFSDPTGRSLLAPDPPPIVTRTRADEGEHGGRADSDEDTGPGWRLPWRRFAAGRRPGPSR